MDLVDYLLNGAGLLLWLSWRSVRFVKPAPAMRISSVLHQVESRRTHRWLLLAWLVCLLFGRSLLYWRIGSRVNWVPVLDIGSLSLQFNSVSPVRMLVFSFASFGVILSVLYIWLMLLDVVNRRAPESDIWQKLVRLHLGFLRRFPAALKLVAPAIGLGIIWVLVNPLLVDAGMAARPGSSAHLIQQAVVVGAGAFLAWKYLIVTVLFLGVLNTYLYLGSHSFWTFVSITNRHMLGPVKRLPLRIGKIDLSGALALAAVWLVFTGGERFLSALFMRVPL